MSLTTNHSSVDRYPTGARAIDVDAVRSDLLTRRAEHSARLQLSPNQSTTIDDDGAIDVGIAFERFSIEQSRDTMVDIDAAIARLDDGTYGSCETCHHPIAPERLEAIPHARRCIRCADSAPRWTTDRGRS